MKESNSDFEWITMIFTQFWGIFLPFLQVSKFYSVVDSAKNIHFSLVCTDFPAKHALILRWKWSRKP